MSVQWFNVSDSNCLGEIEGHCSIILESTTLLVFGGFVNGELSNTVWWCPWNQRELGEWSKAITANRSGQELTDGNASHPLVRDGASATVIPTDPTSALVFGGFDESYTELCDLVKIQWDKELNTLFVETVGTTGTAPTPRVRHSACFVNDHTFVILFGETEKSLEDGSIVWLLDWSNRHWTRVTCSQYPSARAFVQVASLLTGKSLLAVGGSKGTIDFAEHSLRDAWRLIVTDNTVRWIRESKLDLPQPTNGGAMVTVSETNHPSLNIFLFGGKDTATGHSSVLMASMKDKKVYQSWRALPSTGVSPTWRFMNTLHSNGSQVVTLVDIYLIVCGGNARHPEASTVKLALIQW